MKLSKHQHKFIVSWGGLASQWGVNKTLAQIHGLFLVIHQPVCMEDIMELLHISRGNVNMNVRTLIDWGMIYKQSILGERREFYVGEKDMWLILKRMIKVRKERELDPMLRLVREIKQEVNTEDSPESSKEFVERIELIERFASQADSTLNMLLNMDEKGFLEDFR
ncbi:MAG: transcriptional regulator [Flavobacteriaceae bacterium]|jgi:DNA-binding transcriptional regulator GbsR (MarR family)|nr:transcriptional regulator [Flavobacteriaceae bacterium]